MSNDDSTELGYLIYEQPYGIRDEEDMELFESMKKDFGKAVFIEE